MNILKKINDWLHLWLGLASGIIVIILSITGCVLVFEQEIKELTTSYINVDPQTSEKQLPPSALYKKIQAQYPELHIESAWYYGLDKSVKVSLENSDSIAYVNPYTGAVLALVDHEDLFMSWTKGTGIYGFLSRSVVK